LGQGLFPSSGFGQNDGEIGQEVVRCEDFGIAGGDGYCFIDEAMSGQFKREFNEPCLDVYVVFYIGQWLRFRF